MRREFAGLRRRAEAAHQPLLLGLHLDESRIGPHARDDGARLIAAEGDKLVNRQFDRRAA